MKRIVRGMVPVALMRDAPRNPNVMTAERYALLRAGIQREGFTQEVLIRPLDEGDITDDLLDLLADGGLAQSSGDPRWMMEIVDGHHRRRAATEVGLTEIPSAIAVGMTAQEAEAVRIAMNRLRGEQDLSVVGAVVRDLAGSGWDLNDLAMSVGFSDDELADLLRASEPIGNDVLADGAILPEERVESETPPLYMLELPFADRVKLQKVKRALKRVGSGDMTAGLLRLIDER